MSTHGERAPGSILVVLASIVFFGFLGPIVGAIVFLPDLGFLAAGMLAHGVGLIPALLTGLVNGIVVITGFVRSQTIGGRVLHGLVGGLSGLLITTLFLDYPDWVLMNHASSGYEFWYTFHRDYIELSVAGFLAGGVCSFVFNPWAQRQYPT